MVGIKSKISPLPSGITTSKRCTLLTVTWVSLQHLICIREGGFAKISPIYLKIKHSGDHFLTTLLGHSETRLLWKLILFDSEPKAWFSDVTITCSASQGNYLRGANALVTIASVGATVIAIHQGSNLLRASIHKLRAINKLEPGPLVPTFFTQ